MKFLIFADLHQFNPLDLDKIKDDFDIIILLGDITTAAIKCILKKFDDKPVYGIYGNHDNEGMFESVDRILDMEYEIYGKVRGNYINNINLKSEYWNDIWFTGLNGSVKYKDKMIGYSQEEALDLYIPIANILFSHETGYLYINNKEDQKSHEGFKAISKYIKENRPKYHIFGHHHINTHFIEENTRCYCVYGCSVFDYETGNMKNIF
jgi:Icc-related predicted phosphoesterase